MAVHLQHGFLEFFLRYPGSRTWTRAEAFRFLTRAFPSAREIVAVRRFLMEDGRNPIGPGLDARDVLQHLADLVASGQVVVTQPHFGDRAPVGGIATETHSGHVGLMWRHWLNPAVNVQLAIEWLHGVAPDSNELRPIRTLLGQVTGAVEEEAGGFAARVERLLRSGDLLAIWHAMPQHVGDTTPPQGPPPSSSQGPRAAADEAPPPLDAATFPSNIDAAQIAQVKREAARLGIPFCEECLKRQMRGEQS